MCDHTLPYVAICGHAYRVRCGRSGELLAGEAWRTVLGCCSSLCPGHCSSPSPGPYLSLPSLPQPVPADPATTATARVVLTRQVPKSATRFGFAAPNQVSHRGDPPTPCRQAAPMPCRERSKPTGLLTGWALPSRRHSPWSSRLGLLAPAGSGRAEGTNRAQDCTSSVPTSVKGAKVVPLGDCSGSLIGQPPPASPPR